VDQRPHERRGHVGARTALIHFRPAHKDDGEALAIMVRWANDPAIRHLFRPFTDQQHAARPKTLVSAASDLASAMESGRQMYFIELDGAVVGEVNLVMNPPHLHEPLGETAWFGIVIGEEEARGKGIGAEAIRFIEEVARGEGAIWAQIGVFEFNERARRLYENLGYHEIARKADATWWKGKLWTDIRMQKQLQVPQPT